MLIRRAGAFNYFEILTAMMFVVFQQEAVDLAIIEVGIGGLLDNTNVGHPLVSVITTVGLGHQEKSLLRKHVRNYRASPGIIKAGQQVVVGPVSCECMDVIRGVASEKGATVQAFGEDFFLIEDSYQDSLLTISLKRGSQRSPFPEENATIAVLSISRVDRVTGRSVAG